MVGSCCIGAALLQLCTESGMNRQNRPAWVAEDNCLPASVVRTAKGLHDNAAWRNFGQKRNVLAADQRPPEDRFSPGGCSMQPKLGAQHFSWKLLMKIRFCCQPCVLGGSLLIERTGRMLPPVTVDSFRRASTLLAMSKSTAQYGVGES